MHLLVFIPTTAIGGAERVALNLVNHASAFGIHPTLVIGADGPLSKTISADVDVVRLGIRRSRNAVLPLMRILRSQRPDFLFGAKPNASIAAALAWALAGRPGSLILRETNHRTAQGMPRYTPFSLGLWWAYRQARTVIASTHAMREDLLLRYRLNASKVHVLNNPIDLRAITHSRHRFLPPRSEQSDNKFKILAVGRLIKQKGFDVLLQALAQVRDHPTHLTILGDGPEKQPLQRLCADLQLKESVTFAGFDANPYPWMYWADTFVLSSRWEGFPNALVESMALGLPVIATRCLSGPEEIITHQQDGLLCPVNSPDAIAEHLRTLIIQPEYAGRLGKAAAVSAQRFSVESFMQHFIRLLSATAENKLCNGDLKDETVAAPSCS